MASKSHHSTFYPIVGRKDTGKVFDRISIEKMQAKHPEQFTLFILAFLQIQGRSVPVDMPVQNGLTNGGVDGPVPLPPGGGAVPNTFYDIGALHGRPYQIWPGEMPNVATDFDLNDPKDMKPVLRALVVC